jgi:hypothetical protein
MKLDVLGMKVNIVMMDSVNGGADHGEWCPKDKEIRIDQNMTDEQKELYTLHELIHAHFFRIGLTETIDHLTEEIIADTLSTAIAENYRLVPKNK